MLRNTREIGPNLDTVKCNKMKITQSLSSGLDQMYAFCAAIGELSSGDVERTHFLEKDHGNRRESREIALYLFSSQRKARSCRKFYLMSAPLSHLYYPMRV